jgi:hypothetical protein
MSLENKISCSLAALVCTLFRVSSASSILLNKEKTLAIFILLTLPPKPQPLANLKKDRKRTGKGLKSVPARSCEWGRRGEGVDATCYATAVQFACNWRPLGYNLYATGRQSHANFAHTIATSIHTIQCKAASFLKARCQNNYLN